MVTVLDLIYSWPFLLGATAGLILDRLYKCLRAYWLNKHYPLPDGEKHRAGGYNLVYVGAVLAAATLGYVALTMAHTEHRYEGLALEIVECQKINTQNDRLSRQQRDLFLERFELESIWTDRLVNVPPQFTDPERIAAWRIDVTRVYRERAGSINAKIRSISDRQAQLEAERLATPTCVGKANV